MNKMNKMNKTNATKSSMTPDPGCGQATGAQIEVMGFTGQ